MWLTCYGGSVTDRPRAVIIGAGFGGLECAKRLAGWACDVTVVDQHNYHLFTPLLYQVASSLLNPSNIAQPVRTIFRGRGNVRFRHAAVTGVDFERREVRTMAGETIHYDYLVLAAGSTTNFFGNDQIEARALGLKDLGEALELRNHILRCLERAASLDAKEAEPWLTFVVAGGGPTGVEYAGALSELTGHIVPREYPELVTRRIRIILVEGDQNVLPPFPPALQRAAREELARKGVEVHTGVLVKGFEDDAIRLSNGETLRAKSLVWAAGVKPNGLAAAIDVPRSPRGRIEVDGGLRIKGRKREFAIGDIASFQQGGREVPMLSAPAMQEGRVAAANIIASIEGRRLRRFRYLDKGSMATIGKGTAVAQIGKLHLSGLPGWFAWLAVHLYYIIGFRNRLLVLAEWAWNYVGSDRPVRIIARAAGEE